MISQAALLLLVFFSQRVMNLYIGKELVGLNGVISNVINMLSVTELGVILLPFIHLFMNESSYTIGYIRLLYGIWLVKTVLSYLLSYKKSLLIADQKEYIVSIATMIINVVNYSAIILIVRFTRHYIPALLINIVVEVVLNLWVSLYVDRKYPFLHRFRKQKVERNLLKKIFRDLKHIFISKISQNLLNCTDNLIVSSGISVAVTGLFSLITPFVTDFWLEKGYEMGKTVVWMCIIVFVTRVLGLPLCIVLSVSGMFKEERNLSIITAIVNLGASLILIRFIGLAAFSTTGRRGCGIEDFLRRSYVRCGQIHRGDLKIDRDLRDLRSHFDYPLPYKISAPGFSRSDGVQGCSGAGGIMPHYRDADRMDLQAQ